MSRDFWKIIESQYPFSMAGWRGYDENELRLIEKLYGITIDGQLRRLMTKMGRSSGGIFGDDPIILYRQSWSVRAHLVFQLKFIRYIQDLKKFNHFLKDRGSCKTDLARRISPCHRRKK
jgi:hypothetical protein